MLKNLSLPTLLLLAVPSLSACGPATPDSEAAALCVDLVNAACDRAAQCESELGSVSTAASSAISSCGSSYASQAEDLLASCSDIVSNGSQVGQLIAENTEDFLFSCVDHYSCSESALDELAQGLAAVNNDPYQTEPLLETAMSACFSGNSSNPDPDPDSGSTPDPDPEPEPDGDPEPDTNPDPDPEPQPDPANEKWNVTVVNAKVASKKANGKNWDCCTSSNAPDVKIEVHFGSDGQTTSKKSGFEIQYDETLFHDFSGANILGGVRLRASDVDAANDDFIGECSFALDAAVFGHDVNLTCPRNEASGQAGFAVKVRFHQ